MLKRLIATQIEKFERSWNYDMAYARELLDIDTRALLLFNRVMPLAQYRRDIPVDAWFAAKIVGSLSEDCGPCTQLVVMMAERAGVAAETLRAVVAREPGRLPPDAQLAYRFAVATLAHSAEADPLREEIVHRWGRRALVSLSFALVAARMFPTLKYALGHGKTCVRVRVGDVTQPVAAAA